MPPEPRPRPPGDTARTLRRINNTIDYWDESTINLILSYLGILATQTIIHEYAQNAVVPSGAETTILAYTVPAMNTLDIKGWRAWADVDAEYFIRIDGTQVGGHRTTMANIVASAHFPETPIEATAGQIVTIKCYRQSPSVSLPFSAELMGVLNG